jgi:hypothetical protein
LDQIVARLFERGRLQHRQAAGTIARSLIALLLGDWMTDAALSGVTAVEKRELSKIDFEIIDCNIALIR